MTLVKAKAKVKHIYSTGIIYDHHLRLSKYFYSTGHWAVGLKSMWITNNWHNIVVDFHQDFMASTHSDFYQGQMNMTLLYWPHHSEKTWLSNQEEDEEESILF
jgi:hypothetical protein